MLLWIFEDTARGEFLFLVFTCWHFHSEECCLTHPQRVFLHGCWWACCSVAWSRPAPVHSLKAKKTTTHFERNFKTQFHTHTQTHKYLFLFQMYTTYFLEHQCLDLQYVFPCSKCVIRNTATFLQWIVFPPVLNLIRTFHAMWKNPKHLGLVLK